jgi:4-hydroxyproline epimerase
VEYIDSHTAGEPTRTVIRGAPDLGTGNMAQRLELLRSRHDWLRQSVVLEPRGCDWLVGALLQPPTDPASATGVIFFNNVGYLGMCGHGLIGVVATLHHLGRIGPGVHRLETPAGCVTARLRADKSVSVTNVLSYRHRQHVSLHVPAEGTILGDVAYGGNWFFLASADRIDPLDLPRLLLRTRRIREALGRQGVRGRDGAEIDHIELVGPPSDPAQADSRNFVLCPGGEYDRSPCGTGTSAKLACLAADGRLAAGQVWRQESILGTVFEGTYETAAGGVVPTITGRAYVTAHGTCLLDEDDPFAHGIQLPSFPGQSRHQA